MNTGNRNTGDRNTASNSAGCFNTKSQTIYMFNKPSDWTYDDWLESKAMDILSECPHNDTEWITEKRMTKEEKAEHSEYVTTGGYLKTICVGKQERQFWWNKLSIVEKDMVKNLPNFDREIFKEITGIEVEE